MAHPTIPESTARRMAKTPYFCDECGTRNTQDSKYCKECGAQIQVAYQTQALTEYDRIDDPTEQERLTQFLDMAFWHNEAGNTETAMRACKAALALNPNSTTALSLLGSLYEKQGDDAQAIVQFERVLSLNPDSEADRFKLMQLQEGVHTKPVQPSPVYRWLPPVFGTARFSEMTQAWGARWAEMRRPEEEGTRLPTRMWPVLAGVAAVVVLAGGLFLVRPPARGPAEAATVAASPVARSAFGTGATAPRVSMPAPVAIMPPRPETSTPLVLPPPPAVASVPNRDPFAGTIPEPLPSALVMGEPLPRGTQSFASGGTRSAENGLRPLPPLVAVPSANAGSLPPAPVTVEANAPMPLSPDSGLAHHTVVVSHLGGLSEFGSPDAGSAAPDASDGYSSQDSAAQDTSAGGPSRIQITVDPSPNNGSSHPQVFRSAASGSGASAGTGGGSISAGESEQQTAFALQQQGNYRQAAAAYGQAISAYQAQIAAGQDRDAAERGLQACQTGIQICRESQ